VWSKINCGIAERLIADGLMSEAGMREVNSAKADGRWDRAYEPASKATVPGDLQAAIDASPKAKAFFKSVRGTNRYAMIYRTNDAKTPATRAKRIQQFVEMLERKELIFPAEPKT